MNRIKIKYKEFDFYVYDTTSTNHCISHCIKNGAGWELEQLDFIINSFPESKGNMIDVGGEIGSYSIILSKNFNTVYTFEPNIDNYTTIQHTIKENDISNIKLYNSACGNYNGKCGMIGNYNTQVSLEGDTVDLIKLDDIVIDQISFLKIDVEGFEYDVLRGAEKLIDVNHPLIYLETHPTIVASSQIDCEGWLIKKGYIAIKEMSPIDKFWKYEKL